MFLICEFDCPCRQPIHSSGQPVDVLHLPLTILQLIPELEAYLTALQKHGRQSFVLALRQLLRMVRDYPRHGVITAIEEAARYGLYNMDRLERMILRRLARDFFLLHTPKETDDDE